MNISNATAENTVITAGRLFLIPVPLGPSPLTGLLPDDVRACASRLQHFVAENAKSARAFLKTLPSCTPLQQIDIRELNEHTAPRDLPELLAPLRAGKDIGLISEAGCPAVADPGSSLVALAHAEGFIVQPMVGPSSILLALMGSGLSGQNFAFHGYLPAKEEQRQAKIRSLEKDSRQEKRTQIFIETPYRNNQMLKTLTSICTDGTKICVATDLTLGSQEITTHTCAEWLKRPLPMIDRRPTVFLLQA
ncbi:SAM-dependent methyltransferase [Propionivibrio limicola]|uniref:SAM-dependent methyltransferase n=1 Tax=Propionivibrio limicola TaxID=167645 RepID=UPI001B874139|nr:SAM-dependent methyltransferase [Propionivibrio limicola]